MIAPGCVASAVACCFLFFETRNPTFQAVGPTSSFLNEESALAMENVSQVESQRLCKVW